MIEMHRTLDRAGAREVDRHAIEQLGVPSMILMENAGRGAAELLRELGIRGAVAICCGKGNNGGDGFVMARHLYNAGVSVHVYHFGKPCELADDAAINFHIVERLGLPLTIGEFARPDVLANVLGHSEWLVDALFGTGLTGPVRSPFDEVIRAINQAPARVLAVDIPSGLDCDTGEAPGEAVRAEHTATFVAFKKGFANPNARKWTGQVHILSIGVPYPMTDTCRL